VSETGHPDHLDRGHDHQLWPHPGEHLQALTDQGPHGVGHGQAGPERLALEAHQCVKARDEVMRLEQSIDGVRIEV
jgi:hypothetical protein